MEYSNDGKDNRLVQLRKGILELAIMGALCHERHYGYSLVRLLTENGSISLKEGTIYPILARLDRQGLVKSEWVESDQGPPRKYYSLSAAGRKVFAELINEFDLLVSLVKTDWTVGKRSDNAEKKHLVLKR
jgi:PadR family transcriptional regulator, regulatory protein PadR